jgi:tetratricopeptide (TPR) repeat protein
MSSYVWGSSFSYNDYLQQQSFVDDINNSTNAASMEISRNLREILSSLDILALDNIKATEDMTSHLSYQLQDMSSKISQLSANFQWGFSHIIAGIGHMNDSFSDLVKIAKSPVETTAYDHFEIARDAFQKGLLPESLEEICKAIDGDHVSSGYRLEWRFYRLRGIIRLGSYSNCDSSLIDLIQAEESFLLAARYSAAVYPKEAAIAFLSAGWAAYCQGKMNVALEHTQKAVLNNPNLAEALFQISKIYMAIGDVEPATQYLEKAIDIDRFYAVKAAGDGDFKKHESLLSLFYDKLRSAKYEQAMVDVFIYLDSIDYWRKHYKDKDVIYLENFITGGMKWPLLDVLRVIQTFDTIKAELNDKAKAFYAPLTIELSPINESKNIRYETEERYQEKVIVRPGGFLSDPVFRFETRSRLVKKKRIIYLNIEVINDNIYNGFGELIAGLEFCKIPAGQFLMGDGENQFQVSISKDFFLGRFPITHIQWQALIATTNENKAFNNKKTGLSWEDCQIFIERLNIIYGKQIYRLPSEAEWEYACRAGLDRDYNLRGHPWGLEKMPGDIREWCQDWHGDYPKGPVEDPMGPKLGKYRMLRGGHLTSGDLFPNGRNYIYSFQRKSSSFDRFKDIPDSRQGACYRVYSKDDDYDLWQSYGIRLARNIVGI